VLIFLNSDKQIIGLYFRDVEKCPIIFSACNQYWKRGNRFKTRVIAMEFCWPLCDR